ncbi:MAG: class I SAM-dependent methyltransferase family protein [Candidatus Thorarchaeota archaeon]
MMSSKKPFIKVPANAGERIRKVLLEHDFLDSEFKILSKDDSLYMPLRQKMGRSEFIDIIGSTSFEIGEMEFDSIIHGPRTLVEALEEHLSETELTLVPRAYDLIGDIAVLEIPEELSQHAELIGKVFHEIHKNFSSVLAKKGAISGTTRTRRYQFLAGEKKTKTIHTEYGCRLAVDLSKAYFSPRLLEEHNRIAQLVHENEFVVDMFCGVGPFPIHITKQHKAHVVAIDINPEAINLLKESMKLNRLLGTIEPVIGDSRTYTSSSKESIADRVIMNHPSGAFEFVSDACRVLKPNGVIHYYDFISGATPEDEIKNKAIRLVEEAGRAVQDVSRIRRVRDSAPREYQLVIDLLID